VNLARFSISGTSSYLEGYDVNPGQSPTLQLEQSSSLVWLVTFDVRDPAIVGSPRATKNAPVLTLSNGVSSGTVVNATTPSGVVSVSAGIPASRTAAHLWEARCRVNNGVNSDGSTNPDWNFSRFIALRSAQGLRKLMGTERSEYDTIDSWAGAINELIDLWSTSGGSVDPTKLPLSSIGTGTATLAGGTAHVTLGLPLSYKVYLTPVSQGDYPGIVSPANQTVTGFDLLSDNAFDNGTHNYLWISL
jgi:hypothetical protein